MRILICHNFYQQAGGEDQVFAAEAELLRKHGHDVQTFSLHNDSIETMGKLQLARATLWNRDSAAQVRSYVRGHRAQVVHFHNTFPLLSPSVLVTVVEVSFRMLLSVASVSVRFE